MTETFWLSIVASSLIAAPCIIYRPKDNQQEKFFDALDWLAALTSHIPNHGEQLVRYYGGFDPSLKSFFQ